ncbi:MAG: prolipoprotein diacylglyceryl transferase [Bdellovibrionaceae bacterium]|nr:prolipoprotein diacylglyceryl transferase [Pseudobdellovibrionaceae bacterium]MBX3033073.1 prolipoprotein diacylglyceryl transferase [Pseudobdellovibrionaceae bacterium]
MHPWLQIGDSAIPVFLLVQSLNACLILLWASRRAADAGLSRATAIDLVLLCLGTGLIGGRLLHVLWEAPEFYRQEPLRVLNLMAGGYVYYGGLLFAVPAGWLFLRAKRDPAPARWFDFSAPLLSLGTAIGRLGCFFAGCCYGKVCVLPWAFPFKDEQGLSLLRHPTQLYSFFWEIGVLLILLGLERFPPERRPRWLRPDGSVFLVWMILHAAGRFAIEAYRDDFRGAHWLLSLSQWVSLALILAACLILRQRQSALDSPPV